MLEEKIIGHIENGYYVVTQPVGLVSNYKKWPQNIPSFDDGVYDGLYSGGDGCIIACINNSEKKHIQNYITKLKNLGYSELYKNMINKNLFYTYSNGLNLIYFYLIENLKTVKVIAEPFYEYSVCTEEKNIVKPAIIASSVCDRNFYVRLPDNSLVVIDGGWRVEDWYIYDHFDLMQKMYDEMRSILGVVNTVHIPLWIVTHPHTDHVRVLETLYKTDIKDKFIIDRILFNFPADNHIFDFDEATQEQYAQMNENFKKWHSEAGIKFPYDRIFYNCPFRVYDSVRYDLECRKFFEEYSATKIKAHDGMKFSLSGVDFEVLHTSDDDMPTIFKVINDTSLIIKMTYKNSSMLWLGDMGPVPSESCAKMYGKALKCDAMQVAHHGWGAATPEFYEFSKPSVLFWNNSEFGFKYADKRQGYGKTKTSTALYNMECVKKNVFCNRIRPTFAYLPIKISDSIEKNKNNCIISVSAISDRIIMMRLPNGKLIIFDGGWRKEDWDDYDHSSLLTGLYNEMCELAGNTNVTVALWAISNTYAHNNRFLECLYSTAFFQNIDIEKIVYNFADNSNKLDFSDLPKNYSRDLISVFKKTGAKLFVAETDMSFSLDGVSVNVMCAGSFDPEIIADTSVIYKVDYQGSVFLYTGDMTDKISKIILEKYKNSLKCDVVQIANHGWENCGLVDFYKECNAELQIWNNSEYGYQFFRKNDGYRKNKVSTEIFNLKNCKLNVFCNQVKPQYFSFPLQKSELKYDI